MTDEPIPSDVPPNPPPPPARRLVRRRDDRILGGVASGLADYLDADPALIRIGWVAVALLTGGFGVLAYLAGWIVIPEEGASAETTGKTRSRRRSPWGGVIWGVILVLIGVVALARQFDLPLPTWRVALSVALILVGLAMIVSARRYRHGGLLVLGLLLTLVLSTGPRIPFTGADSGFGDRVVILRDPAELQPRYAHAFGAMRIEVGAAALPDGTTTVDTSIAFGELRLIVPKDVALRVTATTAFGSTRVMDEELGAFEDSRVITAPGFEQAAKRIDIRVRTAFGSTRVTRGQP